MFFKSLLVEKFVRFSDVHPYPSPVLGRLTGGVRVWGKAPIRGLSGVESHAGGEL